MALLLAMFLSPLLMVVAAAILIVYARLAGLSKPRFAFLIGRSLLYAVIGAGASLVLTIIAIVWFESSTGYSAGNGPLGWIFLYGPLSAALGQLVALIQWWFKKEPEKHEKSPIA